MWDKFATIKVKVEDKLAVLTLNRPEKLNTMDLVMVEELIEALDLLAKEESLNVLLLTGAGKKFCAGADMSLMQERDPITWGKIVERYLDVIEGLINLPVPVVAAINGDAIGGGLGLCTASDIRIATNGARLGFPFIKIGLSGSDMSSSYYLPKLVGYGLAQEMLYTGRLLPADEAQKVGLIHRSVAPEEFDGEVEKWVSGLKNGPGLALRFTKRALHASLDNSRKDQFLLETYAQTQCLQSNNHREGIAAFRQKRGPHYQGCS